MEGENVFDGCNNIANVLLENDQILPPCEVLDSLWVPNSSPSFHGSASMANFEKRNRKKPSLLTQSDKDENGNQDYNNVCLHQPEKKRRLAAEQVKFLEKTFDVENKLEPERKIKLAKELGLQPRQVAIWFQNRRARYRTKQLEKDYDLLKADHDKLKADYDTLLKENEELKNEIHLLSEKLHLREGKGKSETENSPRKLLTTRSAASSARSDVLDSDSPHYTHSSYLEADDSSHIFEADLSDFSQDEFDSLSKRLLAAPCLPKLEEECYNDLQASSSILELSDEDQATWFWDDY